MRAVTIKMIPSKVAFFFFYASIGCHAPFIAVILKSTGLTVRETGLILGLAFVAGTIFPLLSGWAADSTKFKTILFNSIFFGYAALFFSLPFVAYVVKPTSSNGSATRNMSTTNTTNLTQRFNGSITSFFNHTEKALSSTEFSSNLFFALMVVTVLGRGFQLAFTGILDSIITDVIKNIGTNENYGQQIMFSGLGLGLGSVLSTAVSDNFPDLMYSPYMGNFYTFLPCLVPLVPMVFLIYQDTSWNIENRHLASNEMSVGVPVKVPVEVPDGAPVGVPVGVPVEAPVGAPVGTLNGVPGGTPVGVPDGVADGVTDVVPDEASTLPPSHPPANMVEKSRTAEKSKVRQLVGVLKKPDNIVVMTTLVVCGLLRTVSISFVYLFMREDMGASKIELGLAEGMRSLTQFVIFFFSGVLIRTFRGPKVCMGIGLATYAMTLLAVSFVRAPWIAILLQGVRGVGFGLFRAANVKHTSDISPKEIYNTMFLLNICLFIGIPGVVGNFAGGVLYFQFNGATIFQGSCVLGCLWLLFMVLFSIARRRVKNIADTEGINELQDAVDISGVSGQGNESFDTVE